MKEVLERWHRDISNLFPGLRQNPEFAFDDSFYGEILKKKTEFENLPQDQPDETQTYSSSRLNDDISYDEVSLSIDRAKSRKSYLEIPNEALKNENAKQLFHRFFIFVPNQGCAQVTGMKAILNLYQKKKKIYAILFKIVALL